MNDEIVNNTYLLAKWMIFLARKNQDMFDFDPCAAAYSSTFAILLRQFRTINLGVPRASGKTSAAIDLAKKFPSVVFVLNDRMGTAFNEAGVEAFSIAGLNSDSAWQLLRRKYDRSSGLELLLVDEGLMLSEDHKKMVMSFAEQLWQQGSVKPERFTIVFIGT